MGKGKWFDLKDYGASIKIRIGGNDAKFYLVEESRIKELVSIAEKAEAKPKSVLDQIMTWLYYGPDPPLEVIGELNRARMALAEAVEWIQKFRDYADAAGIEHGFKPTKESLESILAILKGEKTRNIPKP